MTQNGFSELSPKLIEKYGKQAKDYMSEENIGIRTWKELHLEDLSLHPKLQNFKHKLSNYHIPLHNKMDTLIWDKENIWDKEKTGAYTVESSYNWAIGINIRDEKDLWKKYG